jgi:hypothetical protein
MKQQLNKKTADMEVLANTEVYSATTYDDFIRDPRNREINELIVKDFIDKFKNGENFMKELPGLVHVNDKDQFVITDGQHRFYACKRLGIPFLFRWQDADSKLTMNNIANVQDGSKWSSFDHIGSKMRSLTGKHKQSYVVLDRLMKKYGLPASTMIAVLNAKPNGEPGGGANSAGLKTGEFMVTDEQEAAAYETLDHLESTFKAGAPTIWKQKNFIVALQKSMRLKGYNKNQMRARMTNYSAQLIRRQTVKEYLRNLEDLYNYNSKGDRLRFL